ncbi:hypothetical protein Tco_0071724 [Tanacetum coccineum]
MREGTIKPRHQDLKWFGYEALLRPTPLPEYPTRDFTMSTSSLQAEKTVYTSLTGVLGKEWYWRMKILRSVLSRNERMAGPNGNRVKVAEKEETRRFRGSPDGGLIPINRGLIQAIPTSLPPQLIGEATKASNLRRIPPGV